MPKTYNSIPTVATGDVYTATAHNNIVTNVNNYRVPAGITVYRSTASAAYTSNTPITWEAEWNSHDSDAMWSSGTDVTIGTTGVYVMSFSGELTATSGVTTLAPNITVAGTEVAAWLYTATTGTGGIFSFAHMMELTAGNVVNARIFCPTGSSIAIKGGAARASGQTRLSLMWLGQVS